VTKKPFGIEIHPHTSPVPGDRFDGFHVGVDFETFADEAEIDVPVYAACEGPLLFKKMAKGYGGVAVQRCNLEDKGVVVIYGHLRLESVTPKAGQTLRPGQRIGVLGTGHSVETDGVRKHLHFGIHESSTTTDIRGYVKTEEETGEWLDALEYMTP
jgi:murein DD-endopeptidase MepM/ murein hydrolase activator NlpD